MNWPSNLDVIVEYDADDRKEKHSKLLKSVTHYGDYGPMAQYETDDGEVFWIEAQYFQECKSQTKLPRIPIEVITRNAEIQSKLAWGQEELSYHKRREDTGLVLPDGFEV